MVSGNKKAGDMHSFLLQRFLSSPQPLGRFRCTRCPVKWKRIVWGQDLDAVFKMVNCYNTHQIDVWRIIQWLRLENYTVAAATIWLWLLSRFYVSSRKKLIVADHWGGRDTVFIAVIILRYCRSIFESCYLLKIWCFYWCFLHEVIAYRSMCVLLGILQMSRQSCKWFLPLASCPLRQQECERCAVICCIGRQEQLQWMTS